MNEFAEPEEWTVSGLPQQKYGFVHDSGLYDNRMDFAIGSKPGKQFSRQYYKFEPQSGEKSFTAVKTTERTKDLDMDMEVISVWSQWSDRENTFGHIVFMSANQTTFLVLEKYHS